MSHMNDRVSMSPISPAAAVGGPTGAAPPSQPPQYKTYQVDRSQSSNNNNNNGHSSRSMKRSVTNSLSRSRSSLSSASSSSRSSSSGSGGASSSSSGSVSASMSASGVGSNLNSASFSNMGEIRESSARRDYHYQHQDRQHRRPHHHQHQHDQASLLSNQSSKRSYRSPSISPPHNSSNNRRNSDYRMSSSHHHHHHHHSNHHHQQPYIHRSRSRSRHDRSPPILSNHHHHRSSNRREEREDHHSRSRRSSSRHRSRVQSSGGGGGGAGSGSTYHDDTNFTSICIKNLNSKISNDHLEREIAEQFEKFGRFTIKIAFNKKSDSAAGVNTPERIAFVNFYRHQDAREAEKQRNNRMLFDYPMYIEPVLKQYNNVHSMGVPSDYLNRGSHHNNNHHSINHHSGGYNGNGRGNRSRSRSRSGHGYPDRRTDVQHRSSYSLSNRPRSPHSTSSSHRHGHSRSPSRPTYNNSYPSSNHHRSAQTHHSSYRPNSPSNYHQPRSSYRPESSRDRSPPIRSSNYHHSRRSRTPVTLDNYHITESDATCTLFVGNLEHDVERDELQKWFGKYGVVEEIEIKRNMPMPTAGSSASSGRSEGSDRGSTRTYAFVKFEDMDMAYQAKKSLNGQIITKSSHGIELKIGYAKVQSTKCLWLSNLAPGLRAKDIEYELRDMLKPITSKELEKIIIKYDPPAEKSDSSSDLASSTTNSYKHALIMFDTLRQAEACRNRFRGYKFFGQSERYATKCDYFEPHKFDSYPRLGFVRQENNHNSITSSSSTSNTKSSTNSVEQLPAAATSSSQLISSSVNTNGGIVLESNASTIRNDIPCDNQKPVTNSITHSKRKSRTPEPPIVHADKPKETWEKDLNDVSTTEVKNDDMGSYESKSKKTRTSNSTTSINTQQQHPSINSTASTISSTSNNISNTNGGSSLSNTSFEKIIITTTESSRRVLTTKLDTSVTQSPQQPTPSRIVKSDDAEKEKKSDQPEGDSRKIKLSSQSVSMSELSHVKLPEEKKPSHETVTPVPVKPVVQTPTSRVIATLNERFAPSMRQIKSVIDLKRFLDSSWTGYFKLKRESFPMRFFFLSGDHDMLDKLLKHQLQLHITQRTRLETSKVDDFEKRLNNENNSDINFSILIGLPTDSTPRNSHGEEIGKIAPLQNLIEYLDQKEAAGVISLNDEASSMSNSSNSKSKPSAPVANMNIFTPNCLFIQKLLKQLMPDLSILQNQQLQQTTGSSKNMVSLSKRSDDGEIVEDPDVNFLVLLLFKVEK